MKLNATISTPKKKKGPFIQNGKRERFIQPNKLGKDDFKRKHGQEKNADEFAKMAIQNEHIRKAFLQYDPFKTTSSSGSEPGLSKGHPLPKPIVSVFKKYYNEDFSEVLIHKDPKSTQLAKEQQAAALAIETHIFLNGDVLKSVDVSAIFIVAPELFHTINAPATDPDLNIQPKPLSELNDRSPEQIAALDRAAKISEGEQGKVNSKAVNPDKTRVRLTGEADSQMDRHLEKSVESTADSSFEKVDLSVNTYDTALKPIAEIAAAEKTERAERKEKNEVAIIDPKAIMAKDQEFKSLSDSLTKNAKRESEHDTPDNKAKQAQGSAVSPKNERASKAKARKVERLGALPPPKQFNANELKESILHELTKLLKQKEEEANRTGDKPKINDSEIKGVKDKSNQTIQQQKTATIGDVEKVSKEVPDESSVEERTATDFNTEDPGKRIKISKPENAIAKPIAEERISLEKESEKIDVKMAENDIDEQQLGDSDEPIFTDTLREKRDSQQEVATIKQDYRAIEEEKLNKDKETAKYVINVKTEQIHDVRKDEFGNVDSVKGSTRKADEAKRKEIADHVESIYTDSEKSVNAKLSALETSVNAEFDDKMTIANTHFKENINEGIDNEFTAEWFSKAWDRSDYNKRVKNVFVAQSEKYKRELSDLLDPLTQKIANTLNAITLEIATAKKAVEVFVQGLEPSLQAIGVSSAKEVMKKFSSLENSIEQKQEALSSSLANKYAAGVSSLEAQFKEVMDSRKSWLDKAYHSVVGVILEILNLLSDLKKALEQAAEYAGQIIKKPKQFFNNLVAGATIGFTNFVKNIKKHLINGALEWVTGEMSSAGIILPKEFNFKGILSIILQVLGISVVKVKEIAKKVIGPKYVAMLEKGVDIGKNVGGRILKIFSIIKKEGIMGLWEFIKEEFHDLKEKLMLEAQNFIIVKIVQTAVAKLVAMLVPGAGFISAIKSLIDFMLTLFAKARAIVNIIMGIVATFGQILAGNISKVSTMIEGTLARFLGMAITFLAAILGLGNVGRKMNEIIQKKIKDPITKAITKIMEKLKIVMTKLGVFKLLDKIDEGIEKGKAWLEEKKESAKAKVKSYWAQMKDYIKKKFRKTYKEKDGSVHQLIFNDDLVLERHSVSRDLGNYLLDLHKKSTNKDDIAIIEQCLTVHEQIVNRIGVLERSVTGADGKVLKEKGKTIKEQLPIEDKDGRFILTDQYFGKGKGKELANLLSKIAENLRQLSVVDGENSVINIIPRTIIDYKPDNPKDGVEAIASMISLDSAGHFGSSPSGSDSDLTTKIKGTTGVKSRNVIRGHLINHELFGPGNAKNLAPITSKANTAMFKDFEKDAKNKVHSGKVISLVVNYHYGAPNGSQADKFKGISKLPAVVNYGWEILVFSNPSTETPIPQDVINKRENWNPKLDTITPEKSIPINHDDFF